MRVCPLLLAPFAASAPLVAAGPAARRARVAPPPPHGRLADLDACRGADRVRAGRRASGSPIRFAEGGIIAVAAVAASTEGVSARVRSACASFGLIASSAVLVHLWNGAIEAHFHFFVMIAMLALYQDWLPFGMALGHGRPAPRARQHVRRRSTCTTTPAAIAHPWRWSLIHGGFVLAASAAHVVAWRANETQLLRDPLTGLPSRLMFSHRLESALERLQPPARRGRGAVPRPRPLQARQRLARATAPATSCSPRPPSGCARWSAATSSWPASAATSSPSCCEDLGDEQDALAVAERVLKSLGQPFPLDRGQVVLDAPASASRSPPAPGRSADELMRDADAAMYRAKQNGGGRYRAVRRRDAPALRRAPEPGERPAPGARPRRAGRALPARAARRRARWSGSRRWCAGSTRSAAAGAGRVHRARRGDRR